MTAKELKEDFDKAFQDFFYGDEKLRFGYDTLITFTKYFLFLCGKRICGFDELWRGGKNQLK